MKKSFMYYLLINLVIFQLGCSKAPKVEIKSAEFVDNIIVNKVSYRFKAKDIVRLEMNFYFKNDLAPEFEVNSKEHRAQVYKIIVGGANFYVDNKKTGNFWGYWPEKSGKKYAKSMTLFYVVPKDRPKNSLKFIYEGKVLGNPDYHFTYTNLQ